jgi:thioredoxin 1
MKLLKVVLTGFLALSTSLSWAGALGTLPKYDAAKVESLMAAGKPIALVFTMDACPVCNKQVPELKGALQGEKFQNLAVFQIDQTTEKDLNRKYEVKGQSTILLFKGTQEVSRTRGLTSKSDIERELNKLN